MYYNDSEPENDWGVVKTDKFAVNPNNKPRIFVIDDFYTDPMALRQFVTSQWYFDDSGFEGLRTRKQFFFHGVKEKFEQTIGKKITVWEEHSMNARFQNHKADFRPVYHCDSQTWAAAVYLNPDAPYEAGTSFYAHKVTGCRGGEDAIGGAFNGETYVDPTPYVKVDEVGNIFNRCVIWDAKLIHAAPTYFGWDIDSARATQVFFFDTEGNETDIY
tara:strand:- start:130 stop:777 length:648 start_codon:yes stop_codon:yes gene_type:complete